MNIFRVIGFDPSTDITGVVIADFDRFQLRKVQDAISIKGISDHTNTLTARAQRIQHTRECLETWLTQCPFVTDLSAVGYEFHTGRGDAASEAIPEAVGAYLTIAPLFTVPHYRINPQTAKAVWGGTKLPREQAKPAAVRWARTYGITLSDTDDAIADALAVAIATWEKWRTESNEFDQGVLFGTGARKFHRKAAKA